MSVNNNSSSTNAILSTFSLTLNNNREESRFEKLASLKKLLRTELNKSITIDECDAVLLAGALLLNDIDTVKEQSRLINDINIRLWGNAVDPLSKWIQQYNILPQVKNMNKFIEGNTPLHFAVLTGNFENIAFLLSKQADPFLKNAHGDKPLELCQDYHRKLHGKNDKKRKRHKSLKKRSKKKSHSHKRSKSCNHKDRTSNNKREGSNSYDNDADDENESDFFYNSNSGTCNTSSDTTSNSDCSLSSSSMDTQSPSPMHLSHTEFDQLFTNAVKGINNINDKCKDIKKGNNANGTTNNKLPNAKLREINVKKKYKKNGKGKNKLKCKSIGRKSNRNKSKHNKNNHGKNNRKNNKNKRKHIHKRHNNKKINNNSKVKSINKNNNSNIQSIKNNIPSKSDSISISSSSDGNNNGSDISGSSTSISTCDSISSDTISSVSSISSDSITDNTSTGSSSSISTSVTLSSDSDSNTSMTSDNTTTNSVEINIDRKNGKIIAKSLKVSGPYSSDSYTETSESSCDEVHITSECEESSSIMSSDSSGATDSSDSVSDHESDKDNNAMVKLLQETMDQRGELKIEKRKDENDENDLHQQLVPIIIALSEINIFAESASLARIVKFICTLIFFVALHWLEGNSAAKMIVKVGVSIIYLAAMFGHRINEWKECIDAETVIRKQAWTKQRDKERQKRKDRLQKTLRSPDSKRCVAKKQRKLERDMFYKQAEYDWRGRIRMMINHAESAFLQHKWEMAEIYFSRLLGFLMENETDRHVFLNRKSNLKIHKRWKGVFDDYYSVPIAKMFSRRAYCLCKIKAGEYPHGAPANMEVYKSIGGHIELAIGDLKMAIQLREMSPIYQKFVKLYKVNEGGNVNMNDVKWICDDRLDVLVMVMSGQLCDLISLGGLYDLKDEFEKAYENTLQADDIIHCLNKFNKGYVHVESEGLSKKHMKYMCLFDDNGNFKLSLNDMLPLKEVKTLMKGKSEENMNKCKVEVKSDEMERSKSMISLLQISHSTGESKLYSVDIDDGKIMNYNKLELMDDKELERLLAYPLRRKIDLNGYRQLIGMDKCSMKVQNIIDEQLKTIRLLRLQAANRQRAVNLKNERDKLKYNKTDKFTILFNLDNDRKKRQKKDKSKPKHQKEKIEKIKIKNKNKIDKIVEKENSKDKSNKPTTKHSNKNIANDSKSIKKAVVKCDDKITKIDKIVINNTNNNEHEDEVKVQMKDTKSNDTNASDKKELKLKLGNPSSPVSEISAETNNSITLSMCSDVTNTTPISNSNNTTNDSIASTIMEYGTSFSVIKSDKEHDDNDCEETKMSMVKPPIKNNNNNNKSNKNKVGKKKPQRRSQIKLKKLKKKNRKIAKKKTKKNQSKNSNTNVPKPPKKQPISPDDNDERLSISSELSKSPSIETNETNDDINDDDSLSILSEYSKTSSENSIQRHKQKNVSKNVKHKKYKSRTRNIPPRQQSQQKDNKRSPKDSKYYRKKGKEIRITTDNNNSTKGDNENENDEPREHWLWNVNCDFWPNCRNSHQCPFKHPTDKGNVVRRRRTTPKSGDHIGKPINCRFGSDCSRTDCWFWHPGDDETFISSIPTSPSQIQNIPSQTNDEPVLLRDRSLSTHSEPSVINTEHSYEIIEDTMDNKSNKSNKSNEQIIIIDAPVNNKKANAAVIISKKKTRANPWNKVNKVERNNERGQHAHSVSNLQTNNNTNTATNCKANNNGQMDLLSPTMFNNKQILIGHRRDSNLNIRANVNAPPPLTTTITVGAIYHNEFNINDYNISDMIRPPKTNIRKAKTPTASGNRKSKGSKIKSNLNPNASEFSTSRAGNKHKRMSRTRPPSAPIRPPMRNHYFDTNTNTNKPAPKSVDIPVPIPTPTSAPFDPHSQSLNGGVFTPHNNRDHTSPVSAPIFGSNNTLGTHIGSPNTNNTFSPSNNNYYSGGWGTANANANTKTTTTTYSQVSIDEYKQAPNFNGNDWNYSHSHSHTRSHNDYGDESKVVENSIDDREQNNRVVSPSTHPWICPSCSFLNEIGTTACELCSSVRIDKEDKNNNDEIYGKDVEIYSKEQTPIDIIDFDIKDIMGNNNYNSYFSEGDNIIYTKQTESGDILSYEGIIIQIRDSNTTPWPIQIKYEYISINDTKETNTLWVLQEEITKINDKMKVYNDDELYDYDDEDD